MGAKGSLSSTTQTRTSWQFVLLPYVTHPDQFLSTGDVLHYTSQYVIVKDKYPKSNYHYLILPRLVAPTHSNPRTKSISSFFLSVVSSTPKRSAPNATYFKSYLDLQGSHFEFYDQLFTKAAESLIQSLLEKDSSLNHIGFRQGFHACPSLYPLHYHVLSNDFLGTGLKKKHHWNSFTTPFLISLSELRKYSTTSFPNPIELHQKYISIPLRCPWCSSSASSSSSTPFVQQSSTRDRSTPRSMGIKHKRNETQEGVLTLSTPVDKVNSSEKDYHFKSMPELLHHLKTEEHASRLKLHSYEL